MLKCIGGSIVGSGVRRFLKREQCLTPGSPAFWYEAERVHESLGYQTPQCRLTHGALPVSVAGRREQP